MPRLTSPRSRVMCSASSARTLVSARTLAFLSGLAVSGGSVFSLTAQAQTATRNAASAPSLQGGKASPSSPSNPVAGTGGQTDALNDPTKPAVSNVNVLVLALEPLQPQPETVVPLDNADGTGTVTPQRTVPRIPAGAIPSIRPASQRGTTAWGVPLSVPYTTALAVKKKNKMPPMDFGLKPDTTLPPNYYPKGKPPITPDGGAADGSIVSRGGISPRPNDATGETAMPPLAGLGMGGDETNTGLSQFLAAPLRRAVTAGGYTDALDVIPGAPSLVRVINARRLSPLPLTELRNALWIIGQSLNTPGTPPVAQAATEAKNAPATRDGVTQTATPTEGQSRIAESVLQKAARSAARIGQAMGYRVVVVASAVPAPALNATGKPTVNYTLLVVDALRETCEPIAYDGTGTSPQDLETGATTGAPLVLQQLATLPPVSNDQKLQIAQNYYQMAVAKVTAGDATGAKELSMQAVTLNPSLTAASKLLSDLLASTDPAGSLEVLRRATQTKEDGETWGKLAIAQVASATPDWPGAVTAGNRALALGYDSAGLRVALAVAQLNRARLYRNAEPSRDQKADEAEDSARDHLDKAFNMEPANPEVIRLLADQMVATEQYDAAVKVLDRVATQYPNDIDLQKDYAMALMGVENRSEDAFSAWARAWRLAGGEPVAPVDTETYTGLAEGFDRRMDSIGGAASRLSLSVAMGALGREAALLQITKLQADVKEASTALKSLQPPANSPAEDAQDSRALAASLMEQSVKLNRTYLETGQDLYRTRAMESHRQAIVYLKLARATQ